MRRKRLGELLIDQGIITSQELEETLSEKTVEKVRLGEKLVKRGIIGEQEVCQILADQLSIPYLSLDSDILDPDIVKMIPRSIAEKHSVLSVSFNDNVLLVAMADPLDIRIFDTIRAQLNCQIKPAVAPKSAIHRCIKAYYDIGGSLDETISKAAQGIHQIEEIEEDLDAAMEELEDVGAPVVIVVNTILQRAVEQEASDIHIEPLEDTTVVRFRVDGILKEVLDLPKHLHSPVISRVKIISRLDISERRRPQDGRAKMRVLGREVDFRVSIMPTMLGEKVVIRVLDKGQTARNLHEIGMTDRERGLLETALNRTKGIVLVTGPTGSGKTTTLYASLLHITDETKNLITVEDPIEYRLPGVNQMQIDTKIGLTFASGLRSMLRQDPDVIMVGEVRDPETAKIAIQSALTGHLVLSTLHTNDAPSAITRLMDMDIEPFLIAATVTCSVAQRLVRKICSKCKKKYVPSAEVLKKLGIAPDGKVFYHGEGCGYCQGTGYSGRTAVFEIMLVDQQVREKIASGSSLADITETACKSGMHRLLATGLEKAYLGETTLEEVLMLAEDKPEERSFCSNCLETVSKDFYYCPHCRHKLRERERICGECRKPLDAEWQACPYCGTAVTD